VDPTRDFLTLEGVKYELTKEEVEHLKESLEMFRQLIAKKNRQKKQ
jgi:hypothetical protein